MSSPDERSDDAYWREFNDARAAAKRLSELLALIGEQCAEIERLRAFLSRTEPTRGDNTVSDDREMFILRVPAARAIIGAFHDLHPRIPGLEVGDCHCNLLAEVALDAAAPILVAAGRRQAAAEPRVEALISAVAAWRESMAGLMDATSPEEDALWDAHEALAAARAAYEREPNHAD